MPGTAHSQQPEHTGGRRCTVDLWTIALEQALQAGDLASLAADEQRRAAHIMLPDVRRRFVRARGALRRILGQQLGEPAAALVFAYGAHGKPALRDHPGMRFNLSHSGELAVVAISRDGDVGIDLEALRAPRSALALAQRFFSADEAARVAAAQGVARDRVFLRYLTRKEAVLKACGRGIGVDLREIAVGDDRCASALRVAHDPRMLLLCELALGGDWLGALCVAPLHAHARGIDVRRAGHLGTANIHCGLAA